MYDPDLRLLNPIEIINNSEGRKSSPSMQICIKLIANKFWNHCSFILLRQWI